MSLSIGILLALAGVPGAPQGADEGELLLERHVLPVLRESCFDCHGPSSGAEGGFRIDGHDTLIGGGYSGAAIVPGDPDASLLVEAIRYGDPFLEMPPAGKLLDEEIAAIERWIELGAPWPEGVTLDSEPTDHEAHEGPPDVETGREWWSYRPLTRPLVPAFDPARASTPVDAFLVARLDERGLTRNPPASKEELVRRVYHDLHGLPPTFEEVQAFVADDAPDAYERLIDRLLASPRYAEHWARHWLDLVRFAQTNGYERDNEKPYAWRYRDWVVNALHEDKPYDRFLIEQLAGDELPDATTDTLTATGFYRIGPWDDEPDDDETALFDEYDDVIRTVGEGMLGMTLACARCHDHKFDPLPHEDYYAMVAFLRGVRPYEDPRFQPDSATLRLVDDSPAAWERLEAERSAEVAALEAELEAIIAPTRERLRAESRGKREPKLVDVGKALSLPDRKRVQALRAEIDGLAPEGYRGSEDWLLCVREHGGEPEPTHLLVRGNAAAKGDVVPPRPPLVLLPPEATPPAVVPAADDAPSSGRRLTLARWIASPDNPLTARALVNRVWQFHFGRGIAPTVNDLGYAGMPPTHPELLDWLASTFIAEDGWSLKALHRRLLLTDAYRMSSRADNAAALAGDEANELFWRQAPRRLTAEALRDATLRASGELRLEERPGGGRGFFPALSREALAGASRPGLGWELSSEEERARRAVYAFVKRGQPIPLFEAFDGPDPSMPVGTRSVTTTSTQALTLLNGSFLNARARALAERVAAEVGDVDDAEACVARAYELILARRPTEREAALARAYVEAEAAAFGTAAVLVVRPDMPERVDAGFFRRLDGEDITLGPRDGWRALRGAWGNPYNGTLGADPLRGPALLHEEIEHELFAMHADVTLPANSAVGFVFRAEELDDEVLGGIELRLDVEEQAAIVLVHGPKQTTERARFHAPIEPDREFALRARLFGGGLWIEIDREHVGDGLNLPARRGGFGLRAFGEGARLSWGAVADSNGKFAVGLRPDDPGAPALRALEALCLTLYNLNEFLYVD